MLNLKELIGKKFNRLTLLEDRGTKVKKGGRAFLVRCECGTEKIVSYQLIKDGSVKSCGCLRSENSRAMLKGQTWSRLPEREGGLSRVIISYKANARKRNIEWYLSREEVRTLTSQNCYYCNSKPNLVSRTSKTNMTIEGLKRSEYLWNGLDRINNSLGYTMENTRPCCQICNWMKSDMAELDFLNHLNNVTNHLRNKNVWY